jgi:hypothetical protein
MADYKIYTCKTAKYNRLELFVFGMQGWSLKTWKKDPCMQLSTAVIYFPEINNMYKMLENINTHMFNLTI